MRWLSANGWEKFQHYKDRNPPWIRIYTRLIDGDDKAYTKLPDSAKIQLIHFWLLASRHNNKVEYDPDWLKSRLGIKGKLEIETLIEAGFLTVEEEFKELDNQLRMDASNLVQTPEQLAPATHVSVMGCNASVSASALGPTKALALEELRAGADEWNRLADQWGKAKTSERSFARLLPLYMKLRDGMLAEIPEWTLVESIRRARHQELLREKGWFNFAGFFFEHNAVSKVSKLWDYGYGDGKPKFAAVSIERPAEVQALQDKLRAKGGN